MLYRLANFPPTHPGFFLNLGSDNDADEEQHRVEDWIINFFDCFVSYAYMMGWSTFGFLFLQAKIF